MSRALRCDRCDKCFDPEKIDGVMIRFMNPRCYERKDIENSQTTSHSFFPNIGIDDFVDLCPACSLAFLKFMKKGE